MIEFDDFNTLVSPPSIRDAERHYYAGVEDTQRRHHDVADEITR